MNKTIGKNQIIIGNIGAIILYKGHVRKLEEEYKILVK